MWVYYRTLKTLLLDLFRSPQVSFRGYYDSKLKLFTFCCVLVVQDNTFVPPDLGRVTLSLNGGGE